MSSTQTEFCKYLKYLREKQELTTRQVELYSGVSNSYLSQLETGKRGIPTPKILEKLAPIYKVPYEELMVAAGYLMAHEELGKTGDEDIRSWFVSLPLDIREFLKDKDSLPWLELARDMKKQGLPVKSIRNISTAMAEAVFNLKTIGTKLDETLKQQLSTKDE